MCIECQTCRYRNHKTCMIDGKYAEPNHIYASEHCEKTSMPYDQLNIIGHRVRIISKTSSHKGEYGKVIGTTKNNEWLIIQLANATIKLAFASVIPVN